MARKDTVLARALCGAGGRLGWLPLLLAAILLAGCGAGVAAQAPSSAATGAASGGSGALVTMVQKANFGRYLADGQGRTLYSYAKDSPKTSNCYDQCASAWPPFLTTGSPQAGAGVNGSLLGTAARKDGKLQVTYNGAPLYFYAKDAAPGDVNGQRVGNAWFVLSPRGTEMRNGVGTPGVRPATATPAGGNYHY